MNFYIVYLLIPSILFLVHPIKKNYPLVIYWAVVCVLSYDNVTDFFFYQTEFSYIYGNDVPSYYWDKGRELGWVQLMKLFTFTEHGAVIIHVLVLALVVCVFYRFSKKIGLLNVSIWLYFICNLVWKHDNILRQNIAICIAYFGFFWAIDAQKIDRKLWLRLAAITVAAWLFHSSAVLLPLLWLFARWLKDVKFRFVYVFPIVVCATLIFHISGVNNVLNMGVFLFSQFSSSLSSYYINSLGSIESEMTKFSVVWAAVSTVPLWYYTYCNKSAYDENPRLRLCVNMAWIVVTYRICLVHDLLRRPTDYLLWFQVWGYAYFVKDVVVNLKRTVAAKAVAFLFIAVIMVQEYRFIGSYYGTNSYMTVLSEDCQQLNIYTRFFDEEAKNYKRIR